MYPIAAPAASAQAICVPWTHREAQLCSPAVPKEIDDIVTPPTRLAQPHNLGTIKNNNDISDKDLELLFFLMWGNV